jgi:CHAT domain-containing protein/Tfp pilus assembly protein PilF
MSMIIKQGSIKRIIVILFALLIAHSSFIKIAAQQISGAEFNKQLYNAIDQNDDQLAISLIREHRLLVKPFVDGLIQESIRNELIGDDAKSGQLKSIAEKTATDFEKIFGEKSLKIAVNCLTTWSKEQKKTKLAADSVSAAGTRFRLGKEPEKALEFLQKALSIYGNIQDERGEADVLGGIGAVYFDRKDYDKALSYYRKALEKREKVDDKQLTGNTLNSLGSVYYSYLNDYPQAIYYYGRAEALRAEIGDLAGLRTTRTYKGAVLRSLANELQLRGKYPEALQQLEKALESDKELNARSGAGETLSQMGFVYSKIGDYVSAVSKLNEAVKLMQEDNNLLGLAGVYNHLGIVLQKSGRYEKALEYFNTSLNIYEKDQDHKSVIALLNNIGTLFHDTRDYSKAEEYHLKALQISRNIKDQVNEVNCLLNLANDQIMMEKPEEAMLNYKPAYEIASQLKSPELMWKIFAGMAENFEQRGEYERAVELNDSVLKIIEGLRNTMQTDEFKTSFMARERFVFEDIINLLGTLHEKDRTKGYDILAFNYAERSKSRALLDLLSGSRAKVFTQPVSLEEAQNLCPDKNTVILEYSLGDSSSCMWVITRSEHQIFRLPNRKTLQEQVELIRFSMQDPSQGTSEFLVKAGSSLYEELIKPAESFLSKKSRIIIIPDEVLNYLPFELLITGGELSGSGGSFSDIQFLIRKYPLSYVQSASVLKSLLAEQNAGAGTKSEGKSLIAFGDPVFDNTINISGSGGNRFNRLEYSGTEVKKIASLFRNGSADVFLRDEATENNVKYGADLKKYSYLHFATHGYINEDKPELSSLVLTKETSSEEDGLLQATEIFDLKLNADLVVLSACQTGLGKLIRGEGIIGLSRAFMYAGTRSVLVSLWSVSDISTAILMEEFYKNMVIRKLSKTDSLRKAQLTLMSDEKFAHPFYWAPFVLFGNWR